MTPDDDAPQPEAEADEAPVYDPLINYPPNDGGQTITSTDAEPEPEPATRRKKR